MLAIAVATGAVGVGVGSRLKSPNSTEPKAPKAGRIVAPVERKRLESVLVTRGTLTLDGSQSLVPVIDRTGGPAVLTKVVSNGDELVEGQVAFTVDDTPQFVLEGFVPAYRTLRPGDKGRDVLQLDEALKRLRKLETANDIYDEATERAVERLFRDNGAVPVGPTKEENAQLVAARKTLTEAAAALLRARQELATASKQVTDDVRIAAQEAVDAAEDAVAGLADDAEKTRREARLAVQQQELALVKAKLAVPKSERDLLEAKRIAEDDAPIAAARRAVDEAKGKIAEANEGVASAVDAVAEAKISAKTAEEAVPIAVELAAALKARAALVAAEADKVKLLPQPSENGVVVVTETEQRAAVLAAQDAAREAAVAARQAEVAVKVAEREVVAKVKAVDVAERGVIRAKRAVTDAELNVPKVEVGVAKAIRDQQTLRDELAISGSQTNAAIEALEGTQAALDAAVKGEGKVEKILATRKRTALSRLDAARSTLRRLNNPVDVGNVAGQVRSAEVVLAAANQAVAEVEARTGVVLPIGTYAFIKSLPARVFQVNYPVGSVVVDGPLVSIAGKGYVVEAGVERADQRFLNRGDSVRLELQDLAVEATGKVETTGAKSQFVDPSLFPFRVVVDPASLKAAGDFPTEMFNGANAKVSLTTGGMKAAGLVVPSSAVVTRSDRTTVVLVQRNVNNPPDPVAVKTGTSSAGETEVRPVKPGSLKEGDLVVVGEADASGDTSASASEVGVGLGGIAQDTVGATIAPANLP